MSANDNFLEHTPRYTPRYNSMQIHMRNHILVVGDKFVISDEAYPANVMTVLRIVKGYPDIEDRIFYTAEHWVWRSMCIPVSEELAKRVSVL